MGEEFTYERYGQWSGVDISAVSDYAKVHDEYRVDANWIISRQKDDFIYNIWKKRDVQSLS